MSELELSKKEQFNLSRKIRVIDRFGIILQIFAQRAKTRAGQLQIELAWLNYAKTMLVRGGAPTFGQLGNIFQGNMMRLDIQEVEIKSTKARRSGGSGALGGEGETQLEMERRRLGEREAKILKEMGDIDRRSRVEKKKREKAHSTLPLVGLIGYTNAGKTALMNLVTGSRLESQNLLFQTLNTTNKRFRFESGQFALMLDTIGFITNLPHGLVESFKTTLEEIHEADILVHVRDISHPQTNYQRDTVLKVLKDIGVEEEVFKSKYMEVWNKIDLLKQTPDQLDKVTYEAELAQEEYPVILMSCKEGTNKDQLMKHLEGMSSSLMGMNLTTLVYEYH